MFEGPSMVISGFVFNDVSETIEGDEEASEGYLNTG